MKAEDVLFTAGWGSRKICRRWILEGALEIEGREIRYPKQEIGEITSYSFSGVAYPFRKHWYILLHKPCGYECSHTPTAHPSVFSLFPPWLVQQGLQSAGRLDADTSGLLLLSNDGTFLHHVESPRKGLGKRYRVTPRSVLEPAMEASLRSGIALKGEKGLCTAQSVELLPGGDFLLGIDRGVYHQVRRMVQAVGNAVVALHRVAVADLQLPQELLPGAWCELTQEQREALRWH